MGVLFDSTVLIAAERAGRNPRTIIDELATSVADTRTAISVLTVMELAHGLERANSVERRTRRERFLL